MNLGKLIAIPVLIVGTVALLQGVHANEPAKTEAEKAAPSDPKPTAPPAAAAASGAPKALAETIKAEKGTLKNPYTDNPQAIAEGQKIYMGYSCNGCHGGGGGGGMCPPLTNETWIYGSTDDTLFRLITLGSKELIEKQGFARKAQEAVKGPMPPYTEIIDDTDKLWKIIAFIRSVYKGRAEKRDW